jgi:hypothetical protein
MVLLIKRPHINYPGKWPYKRGWSYPRGWSCIADYTVSQGTAVTVLNAPSVLVQIPALTTAVVVTALADIRIVAIPATIIDINRAE